MKKRELSGENMPNVDINSLIHLVKFVIEQYKKDNVWNICNRLTFGWLQYINYKSFWHNIFGTKILCAFGCISRINSILVPFYVGYFLMYVQSNKSDVYLTFFRIVFVVICLLHVLLMYLYLRYLIPLYTKLLFISKYILKWIYLANVVNMKIKNDSNDCDCDMHILDDYDCDKIGNQIINSIN